MKEIPECSDMISDRVINKGGLEGTLDKVKYGFPFKESTFWDRVAILLHDLIVYHYFSDGNKRIGLIMTLVFLEKNGYNFKATDNEKEIFCLEIAQDKKTHDDIIEWIKAHVNEIENGTPESDKF